MGLTQSSWHHLVNGFLFCFVLFLFFSEAGSNSFLFFAMNGPWDNKKNYSLFVVYYLKCSSTSLYVDTFVSILQRELGLRKVSHLPKFIYPACGRVVFGPGLSDSKNHSLTTLFYSLSWLCDIYFSPLSFQFIGWLAIYVNSGKLRYILISKNSRCGAKKLIEHN